MSRVTPLVVVVGLALGLGRTSPVVARPIPQGGGWLHYEVTGVRALDAPAAAAGVDTLVLAGARLHGFIGGAHLGYHVGLDLAAGGSIGRGGLAYDVAVFPIGVALRLDRSVFTLGAGVGAMGAAPSLDDAATFPLEANLELGSGRVRLLARARATYVVAADGRQGGAPTFAFADEVDGTLGLRIGRRYDQFGFPSGNGYFAGVGYRELAGSRFVGLVVGYSIDGATARRR